MTTAGTPPRPAPTGDAAGWGHYEPDEVAESEPYLNGVEPVSPASAPPEARRILVRPSSGVAPLPVSWLWTDRIPFGEVTLIAGREGLGKSTMAIELAAQVSRGRMDGQDRPRAVLYVTTEDSIERTVVPRLMAAGADRDKVLLLDVRQVTEGIEHASHLVLPLDCQRLAAVIAEHDVAMVVLDPMTSAIDGKLDGNSDRAMRQALEPMAAMAQTTGVALVGLAHFGKRDSTDPMKLVLGSSAWGQVVRAGLGVAADPEHEGMVVSQIKNSLGRMDLPSLRAGIVAVELPTAHGPARVGRWVWGEETSTSVADLLGGSQRRQEVAETREVDSWLSGLLAEEGDALVKDVQRAARDAGFSPDQLRGAKGRLGVESVRAGFGKGARWSWKLPDPTEDSRSWYDRSG